MLFPTVSLVSRQQMTSLRCQTAVNTSITLVFLPLSPGVLLPLAVAVHSFLFYCNIFPHGHICISQFRGLPPFLVLPNTPLIVSYTSTTTLGLYWKSLWRGNCPTLLMMFPSNALMMLLYVQEPLHGVLIYTEISQPLIC